MAVEAVNQIADNRKTVKGFELKDFTFSNAVYIRPGDDGVEIEILLHPEGNHQSTDTSCSAFRVACCNQDEWVHVCHGKVLTEYEKDHDDFQVREEIAEHEFCRSLHKSFELSSTQYIDIAELYDRFYQAGNQYGPAFERLRNVQTNVEGQVGTRIELFQWNDNEFPQEHIIHPASLDALSQAALISASARDVTSIGAKVVKRIRRLWLSKHGLNCNDARYITSVGDAFAKGRSLHECALSVMSEDNNHVLLKMDGLEILSVDDQSLLPEETYDAQHFCYRLETRPDNEIMDPFQLKEYCKVVHDRDEPAAFHKDLGFLAFSYIYRLTKRSGLMDALKSARAGSYFQKYCEWMEQRMIDYESGLIPYSSPQWKKLAEDDDYVTALRERLTDHNSQGRLFVTVGDHLEDILNGKTDPLELIFHNDKITNAYNEVNADINCFPMLERYIDILAHKDPNVKVLEVGAGTGGATLPILKSFLPATGSDCPRFSEYCFTDLSSSFFEKARENFSSYGNVRFRTLDVTKSCSEQGIEAGSYDVVIAANVGSLFSEKAMWSNKL